MRCLATRRLARSPTDDRRIVIGAIAVFALMRLMGNLLYKVSPRDPIAYGFALVVLIAGPLVACLLPARRATHIDPARALRV
jgi:ABC-type lipoprotein release transport system permease subunit